MGADQLLRNGEMNGGVSHGLLASGAESWQSRKDAGGTVPAFPEVAPVRTLDSEGPDTDLEMQAAVETILRALGEDTSREGLIKTPLRVVNAFKSAVQGKSDDPSCAATDERSSFMLPGSLVWSSSHGLGSGLGHARSKMAVRKPSGRYGAAGATVLSSIVLRHG